MILALASIAVFAAALVALHLLRPDVAPLARGISHYAYGPAGWLVRVATGVLGVGGLALVAGLALGLAAAARSVAGLALVALWGGAQLVPPASRSTPLAPRRPRLGRSTAWRG